MLRARIVVCLLLLVLLTACGTSTDTTSGNTEPAATSTPAPPPPTQAAAPPVAPPTAPPQTQPPLDDNAWQPFTSEEGRFTILMPGEPRELFHQNPDNPGNVHVSYQVKREESQFVVAFTTLSQKQDDPAAYLESTVQAALNGMGGTRESEQDILLDSYMGKAITASAHINGKDMNVLARYYLVEDRLYQMLAMGDKESVSMADLEKFVTSFQRTTE